jgi:hypothetical protein
MTAIDEAIDAELFNAVSKETPWMKFKGQMNGLPLG